MRFLPLLSLLFASAYGLFINMEPKKTYCFYRSSNKGEKIKINYVCSGKGEKQVGLKVIKIINYIYGERSIHITIKENLHFYLKDQAFRI